MGLIRFVFRAIRNFLIFFLVVAFMPGLPPKLHFDLEPFSIANPRILNGVLAPNNYLNNVEKLFEGRIIGPETLVIKDNEIYASLSSEVVKFTGNHITHIAKFGRPCVPILEEETCGRPLGLALDTISNSLVVADSYYGIWLVDLNTQKKTLLLSPDVVYAGKVPRKAKFFNSVAISKTGDIYWSDSSSEYNRLNGLMSFFANPSGRLFHYNRRTKVNTMLVDNLYFANGVALSPNEEFILVAETAGMKITRHYVSGPKTGITDVFIDALPGFPDNLKGDKDGLWVPIGAHYSKEKPAIWLSMTKLPIVRRFILRFIHLLEMPFQAIQNVYPNVYAKYILNYIGSFESANAIISSGPILIRMDWNGNILASLQNSDGTIMPLADILESNGYLYLGSFHQPYLGRFKLPDIFARSNMEKIKRVEEVSAKQTTTKIPTTTKPSTTSRPTTTSTTTSKPITTTTQPTTTLKPLTTSTKPTTTITQKPITTTTQKPTTTTQQPTTTPTTTTTTTTPKPITKTTSIPVTTTTAIPTTQKPTTTTEQTTEAKPTVTETRKTTTSKPTETTEKPAPIHESRLNDVPPPPPPEKLKIIKRGGEQGEL